MKKVSRILAVLLIICMILSLLPTVFAEGELTGKVIEEGNDMLKYGHIDIPAAAVKEKLASTAWDGKVTIVVPS